MITVAIYSRKTSAYNGHSFLLQRDSRELDLSFPNNEPVLYVDNKGVERKAYFDMRFSKEVGHIAYVYDQEVVTPRFAAPTPFNHADDPADANESGIERDGAGEGSAASDSNH